MSIEIGWTELLPDSQEWGHRHVLYAYLNPHTDEIIYLGMAWHRTVRQRFQDGDKNALRDFFINELGLKGVKVIVGSVWLEGRLTRQLITHEFLNLLRWSVIHLKTTVPFWFLLIRRTLIMRYSYLQVERLG